MQKIKTSLIIPTLNRINDLKYCLQSIQKLTPTFDEILIIEQGDIHKTEKYVRNEFKTLNISCMYLPVKSAAQARNLGIDNANGDYIFIVDDDTILDSNYISVALNYFSHNSHVIAITGPLGYKPKIFNRLITLLMGLNSLGNKILRSGHNVTAIYTNKEHPVQWLCGGHLACRRTVFDEGFRFNKDFIRWSCGEDAMLSYQIYKHYGHRSMMHVPDFKLIHYNSEEISVQNQQIVRMMIIYKFIFWHKEVYQKSTWNFLCYCYGQLYTILSLLCVPTKQKKKLKWFFDSYKYLIKNWSSIANNTIDYNSFILEEEGE